MHTLPPPHSTRLRTLRMLHKETLLAWMNGLKDCSFQQLWSNKLYWPCFLEGKATPRLPQMGKLLCLPKPRCRAALALFGCLPESGFNNLACSFTAWITKLSTTAWVLCPHAGARCWGNWLWWLPRLEETCRWGRGNDTPGWEARGLVCKWNNHLNPEQEKRHSQAPWWEPVVPVTQKAEAEASWEPWSLEPAWAA